MASKVDSMFAALYPGCFRHRSIDLLQIEFVVHSVFVNVRDHVRRLDKRDRKGKTGLKCNASTQSFCGNRDHHGLKLPAKPILTREKLKRVHLLLVAPGALLAKQQFVSSVVGLFVPFKLSLGLILGSKVVEDQRSKEWHLSGILFRKSLEEVIHYLNAVLFVVEADKAK